MSSLDIDMFQWDPNPPRRVDFSKIEAVMTLEGVVRICFQAMTEVVSNGHVRVACQFFAKEAWLSQSLLFQYLENRFASAHRINMINHDSYGVDPMCLSCLGLIEVALRRCAEKLRIYNELSDDSDQEPQKVFNKAIDRTHQEIRFLKKEREFQEKKLVIPVVVLGVDLPL